ncbi:hypothetical protein BGX27_010964 [Mortierella sp. AM989]|nr:hypothetical protein BGX27_010964 [Mortierella sp. AM989]
MTSLTVKPLIFLALLLCFFTSSVVAGPDIINITIPGADGSNVVLHFTVSGAIVAIVLMVTGFFFAFCGYKYFKITLFITGLYVMSK